MFEFELTASGEKWNDGDEVRKVMSDNPHNAITKARIIYGPSFYERIYMIMEGGELVTDYYSYGMLKEKMRRSFGRGRAAARKSWSFNFN